MVLLHLQLTCFPIPSGNVFNDVRVIPLLPLASSSSANWVSVPAAGVPKFPHSPTGFHDTRGGFSQVPALGHAPARHLRLHQSPTHPDMAWPHPARHTSCVVASAPLCTFTPEAGRVTCSAPPPVPRAGERGTRGLQLRVLLTDTPPTPPPLARASRPRQQNGDRPFCPL